MKIRGKLLVLLLVLTITPLVFTAIYGFLTVQNMGESLAERAGSALQDRMKRQLELMIQYNARILRQKQEVIEAWLEHLADSAEEALATDEPSSRPAYLAEDFDAGRVPRTQLHPSQRHFVLESGGARRPAQISTHAQALKLAPGVVPDTVKDSIFRMSSLTPVYRAGYLQHLNLFFWLFTSLENGVHSVYPGHGGYPEEYDGRTRHWYRAATAASDTVWSDLSIDASTKQSVATASRPIFSQDGSLAGVVAIDVPIQAILNQVRSETQFPEDTRVYIAGAALEGGRPVLKVMASLENEVSDWREAPVSRTLESSDPAFEQMVKDITAGRSGATRIASQDGDYVWAYSPYESDAHALLVAFPYTDVARHVEQAKTFVLNQTLGIFPVIGIFLVALIALIGAAAWRASSSVTGPVSALAGAARRLAGGDFGVRVPVKSSDEIGQLSHVFNDIAPQLQDRIKAKESLAHLQRYFSPNLAQQLTENPELLQVGGERRHMTSLFTDLAGFTSLVEHTAPELILPVLNEYLDGMTKIVWEHEGTIDKVVGDAVHAMFGTPLYQDDHPQRGVACGLAMDRYAESFRKRTQKNGIALGVTRIGINSGEATVGNFGGDLMFDYTAHGDTINTAARLEGANKYFGTRLLVSAHTADLIEDFSGRPVGRIVLQGRSSGLMCYAPIEPEEAGSPWFLDYVEAYDALADGGPRALSAFEALSTKFPDDPLVRFHVGRLRSGESGDVIVLAGK